MNERWTMVVGCAGGMPDMACYGRRGCRSASLAGAIFWLLVSWGAEKAAANPPAAVAPAPLTDIHDILPPVAVGIHLAWVTPLLLALTAAVILAAAFWLWKKRRTGRQIETIVPELPPEMTAMRALDAIGDVGRFDPRTFYFRLSAILRQYISGRFALRAPEMTTEEFLPCIDELVVDRTLARQLQLLMRAMDPVKFGAETTAQHQLAADLRFAREFVAKTTPAATDESHDGAMAISTAETSVDHRQLPDAGHHVSGSRR